MHNVRVENFDECKQYLFIMSRSGDNVYDLSKKVKKNLGKFSIICHFFQEKALVNDTLSISSGGGGGGGGGGGAGFFHCKIYLHYCNVVAYENILESVTQPILY